MGKRPRTCAPATASYKYPMRWDHDPHQRSKYPILAYLGFVYCYLQYPGTGEVYVLGRLGYAGKASNLAELSSEYYSLIPQDFGSQSALCSKDHVTVFPHNCRRLFLNNDPQSAVIIPYIPRISSVPQLGTTTQSLSPLERIIPGDAVM